MNIKYNEVAKCPLCGADEVTYQGGYEMCGNGLYYSAECDRCHATWRKWYNISFGEVYDVRTADGQEVSE